MSLNRFDDSDKEFACCKSMCYCFDSISAVDVPAWVYFPRVGVFSEKNLIKTQFDTSNLGLKICLGVKKFIISG